MLFREKDGDWEATSIDDVEYLFGRSLVFHNGRFSVFGSNLQSEQNRGESKSETTIFTSSHGREWNGMSSRIPAETILVKGVNGKFVILGVEGSICRFGSKHLLGIVNRSISRLSRLMLHTERALRSLLRVHLEFSFQRI